MSINSEVYLLRNEKEMYGKNAYTLLSLLLNARELEKFLTIFKEAINFAADNKDYDCGIGYVEILNSAFAELLINKEDYFKFAKYIVGFYISFNQFDKAIELLCRSAFNYSSVGAYQSAYRLLNDAQNIVIENDLLEHQSDILFTQGSICLSEEDYITAEKDLDKAMIFLDTMDSDKQFRLLFNRALLMLRTKRYLNAKEEYESLLVDFKNNINSYLKKIISINLSICQRELGMLDDARVTIKKIIDSIEANDDINLKIEIYLIASRIFINSKKTKIAIEYANTALSLIDRQLESLYRLHYRRGIREQYIDRINQIILDTADDSSPKEMVNLLVFSKLNAFTDWLSVLDWFKEVNMDSSIRIEVRNQVSDSIEKLVNFGTPILYGFSEKYDDPFQDIEDVNIRFPEELNYSTAWRQFNSSISKITYIPKYKDLYSNSKVVKISATILKGLSENKSYIFVCSGNEHITFITLSTGKVNIAKVDKKICIEYLFLLNKYQVKEATFSEFSKALNKFLEEISIELNSSIDSILEASSKEVIIVPDKIVCSIPLIPIFLDHNGFREKLKQGSIKISYAPILYKSGEKTSHCKQGLGVLTPASDLPLLEEEMLVPKQHVNFKTWENVDLSKESIDYTKESVINTDIIHIASHGFPISKFSDPIFGSIAGPLSPYTIDTEEIQGNFWKLKYGLVITNACDSADTSSRNFQKSFKTNEIISYSSLFMLNGKGRSITVNWPIKDIISYIFTHVFYGLIAKGMDYQSAHNTALVSIYELNREEVLKILSSIKDESIKMQKMELFTRSSSEYPLRTPYCYGAFIYTSLL